MRILLTALPEKTTFHPMVPTAWALKNAGHDVRITTQPAFTPTITHTGHTATPTGRDHGFWRLASLAPAQLQAERPGLPEPYHTAVQGMAGASWTTLRDAYARNLEDFEKIENVPMIAGVVDLARRWRPDLILWEPRTFAGPIAAKACGAAHGRLLWSIDVFGAARRIFLALKEQQPAPERVDPLADWLGGYGRRYGFDVTEDMVTGEFTLDTLPPSLRLGSGAGRHLPVRYLPYGGAAVVPDWLHPPPVRPRVAVTLGITAADQFAGYAVDGQRLLDALADLDIEVVATIGDTERHRLTHLPANARIVDYVPLHALAPTCSVVVNHAGPGTLLTTASYAVPQLTVPWEFDEPELARRAAAQGATLTLEPEQATGTAVRAAVRRLLHEAHFAERAAALRDEIRAMPTPNDIVGQLEEFAAHR